MPSKLNRMGNALSECFSPQPPERPDSRSSTPTRAAQLLAQLRTTGSIDRTEILAAQAERTPSPTAWIPEARDGHFSQRPTSSRTPSGPTPGWAPEVAIQRPSKAGGLLQATAAPVRSKLAKAPPARELQSLIKGVKPRPKPAGADAPKEVFHFGEKGSGIRAPNASAIQDFSAIKNRLKGSGELFTDTSFPPAESSLYYSSGRRKQIQWTRASELAGGSAAFINEGASRFDVMQGELGDCWLLAAVANLTLNEKLFHRVVPPDQSFDSDEYAGIFHFRFWQYGKWIDVVVDDYLPTYNGQLIYMHSKDSTEFWSPLLEKAYAKLHGSYEALKGGTTCEAMEDFTGGLTEWYEIQNDNECPPNLFQIMQKAHERSSFMGCSIDAADASQVESELSNGKIPLLRIRNPWGNEAEWKGAWSDSSREWSVISPEEKAELNLNFEADGEFWMSFQDFKNNFTRLEICNLTPEPLDEGEARPIAWEAVVFDGSWVSGVSAGGCRNNLESFATNPQYLITLVDHDEEDDDDLCTLIVALMQKNHRSKRKMGQDSLSIGFAIYKMSDGHFQTEEPTAVAGFKPRLLNTEFFKYNASVARSPTFVNLREITSRFRLPQGQYCIVPSTYDKNEEGEFILRLFTEKPATNVEENDEEIAATEMEDLPDDIPMADGGPQRPAAMAALADDFFAKVAGEDMEVDAKELQQVLNSALQKEFHFDGFSLDSCRSMVALLDDDRSGKLGLDEFDLLWRYVRNWCNVFKKHDADNSNSISAGELRSAFHEAGLTVNRQILQCLVLRYGSVIKGANHVERSLSLDDFVHCCIKLKYSIETWKQQVSASKTGSGGSMYGASGYGQPQQPSTGGKGANFTLFEWVENMMYS